MSHEVEITYRYGDTRTYEIEIVDESDAPIDLDTGTVTVTAKSKLSDDEAVFTKSSGDGVTHKDQSGADKGKATFTIEAADVVGIPNAWTTLLFDCRFTIGDDSKTPFGGIIRVFPSVGFTEES